MRLYILFQTLAAVTQAFALTRFGSASSSFGRLFTDALASNSLSSSRIAAALAFSSSGDGGIGISEPMDNAAVRCRDGAMPGKVTKEQVFVSHSVDHATQATFMVADEHTRAEKGQQED